MCCRCKNNLFEECLAPKMQLETKKEQWKCEFFCLDSTKNAQISICMNMYAPERGPNQKQNNIYLFFIQLVIVLHVFFAKWKGKFVQLHVSPPKNAVDLVQ